MLDDFPCSAFFMFSWSGEGWFSSASSVGWPTARERVYISRTKPAVLRSAVPEHLSRMHRCARRDSLQIYTPTDILPSGLRGNDVIVNTVYALGWPAMR